MRTRKPARMPDYDYSYPGAYFITINIRERAEWFGSVRDGAMILNANGVIAHSCWTDIPNHFPGCRIDEFVVMPDHVHGIVCIDGDLSAVPAAWDSSVVGDAYMRPLQRGADRFLKNVDRTKMKLPIIIQQYKSAVTREINRSGSASFRWQRSYHDRLIRDHHELSAVRNYIRNNPLKWKTVM